MAIQVKRQLFTVKEYYKMAEVGFLTPEDRVELINGEIIRISPSNSEHANVIDLLAEELIISLKKKVIVRIQNPIHLDKTSEPEPDLAIVRYKERRYRDAHPYPSDILLVIEVADSSLSFDREIKAPLYAQAGIPEYWIINLQDQQVEVFQKLVGKQYTSRQILFKEDNLIFNAFEWEMPILNIFK